LKYHDAKIAPVRGMSFNTTFRGMSVLRAAQNQQRKSPLACCTDLFWTIPNNDAQEDQVTRHRVLVELLISKSKRHSAQELKLYK
jgi:hypothetical protein